MTNQFLDNITQYLTNTPFRRANSGFVDSNYNPSAPRTSASADYLPFQGAPRRPQQLLNPVVRSGVVPEPQVPQPQTMPQEPSGIDPAILAYLESTLLPATRQYQIPDALAASQWAAEGGRQQIPNPFGLMRDNDLLGYQSLDETAPNYDLTLRDIMSQNMGIPQEDFSYSMLPLLELMKYLQTNQQGEAGLRYEAANPDPMEYINLLTNTPEFRHYSK